jgi:hypothetical protein
VLIAGYALAVLGLAVQVLLAESANRSPAPRRSAYPAILIAGLATGAVAGIEVGPVPGMPLRVLQLACLGVALVGTLALVRALSRELALAENS